jgi:hypothetical protein
MASSGICGRGAGGAREAGVGKSALLDYLAGAAADMRVARAAGAESEMELALAGLHPLCAPLPDWLERLPAPQRGGLKTAFGPPHRSRAGPIPGRAGGADVAVRGDGRPATAVHGRCRAVAGPGISAGAGVRGAAAAGRAGGTGLPSRGADALHLLWSACLGRVGPGVTGRVHLPARRFPQPTSTGPATRRGQVPQRPAARPRRRWLRRCPWGFTRDSHGGDPRRRARQWCHWPAERHNGEQFRVSPLEDPMTTRACTRRASAPAYYLGRPAAFWLAALAPTSTTRKSPRASCAEQ